MTPIQPDLFAGKELKESGIQLVTINAKAWVSAVVQVIGSVSENGDVFTAEDVRKRCAELGIPDPHHHNAWGAAFNQAARLHMIVRVGFLKNKIPSAHARYVAAWKKKHDAL